MRKMLSNRSGSGLRLAGVAILFMVTTGQASTDGCTEVPDNDRSGAVVAGTPAKAPEPPAGTAVETPTSGPAVPPTAPGETGGGLSAGKYGCTSSVYSGGSYEFQPRGSIVLAADGTYQYLGFEQPSPGRYRFNAEGKFSFEGGYLNGGEATPFEDRPGRFALVAPELPEHRWTCGMVD